VIQLELEKRIKCKLNFLGIQLAILAKELSRRDRKCSVNDGLSLGEGPRLVFWSTHEPMGSV